MKVRLQIEPKSVTLSYFSLNFQSSFVLKVMSTSFYASVNRLYCNRRRRFTQGHLVGETLKFVDHGNVHRKSVRT